MSSPSQQPTVPAPSLARRLGRFLIITGAIAGVAMAVAEPTGQGVNPGPGIVALGLVFLLATGSSGQRQRQGPHGHEDQAPTLSGRLGRFLLVVGAVVGVIMAVLAPGEVNPGSVIIALGLVCLVIAGLGRPGAHHQENEAQQLRNRP